MYLYQDSFDPQNPCAGIFAFGFAPVANIYNIHLDANRQYFFVTSEDVLFGGGGSFQVMINAPAGGHLYPGTVAMPPLSSPVQSISVAAGGSQPWNLSAGTTHAGEPYLVLGSVSGTFPGTPLAGGLTLPLVQDIWFSFTLANPNVPPLFGSFGLLDAAGTAHASGILLPAGSPPSLAGIHADHAFVGSSRVDLQACKLEYSIVSPK